MIQAREVSTLPAQLASELGGRYQIEGELGRGGMAVVFLAEDLKHHRRVAIKVLHPELSKTLASERFLREITLAARLSHPNVLALYDSGEVAGHLYYVMPYAQGESLRDRLEREGALSTDAVLGITTEVAEALTHAHAEGVIHRDIKPENILLSGGHAIVADFGIARAVDAAGGERLTATGLAIGTPAYMSPEQASGMRAVDARSDVYSLACVAYEMLGGDPPFTGGSPQAIMARHAIDTPLPLRTVRPTVSEAIDAVLAKALAKVPGDRFETPVQFVEALRKAQTTGEVRLFWRPRLWLRQRSHRLTAAVAVLAIAALATVLIRQWLEARAARVTSLAVLPIENLADSTPGYFTVGMHNALRGAIGQTAGVRVMWGVERYRNSTKSDTTIARELGVDALVRATVVRSADSVHMQVRLIQARPAERLLWSHAYDTDAAHVMAVHDSAARAIARTVASELPGASALPRPRPVNPASYEAYLRGMYYLALPQRDSQQQGITLLHEAIDKNPGDPLAYAGLALGYATSAHSPNPLPDALTIGRAAALRALTLDSTLAEAWEALALLKEYLEWDWAGAERAFRRANALNPNLILSHYHYAFYLALFDRLDDAIAEEKLAIALNPFDVARAADLATLYVAARRYDDAIAQARKALAMPARRSEGYALALKALAQVFMEQGKHDEAIRTADSARTFNAGLSYTLVQAYANAGRVDEARRVLAQWERLPPSPIVAMNRARMYGALGDNDGFFKWIAYEPHHAWVPWMINERTRMAPSIQKDPRFAAELRRMNLPMPRVTGR